MVWHSLYLHLLFASYKKRLFLLLQNIKFRKREKTLAWGIHCQGLINLLTEVNFTTQTQGQNHKVSVQEEAHMCCTVPFMETATGRKINFRFAAASQYADFKIKLTASRSDLEVQYVNSWLTKNITVNFSSTTTLYNVNTLCVWRRAFF